MLDLMDWFCGAGGSSQGASVVPHVRVSRAANHWDKAIETHSLNFPDATHYKGDIREAPVEKWPVADLFWASPECPKWTDARGKKRDFENSLQGELFDTGLKSEEDERSRALMEEVPGYLAGVIQRGGRVRAGVVENVIQVRAWDQWNRWIGEIRALGYRTRVIALNSMHAQPARTLVAPQSRDRLYVAYWDEKLGREPDWDKWLRPRAFCEACDQWVSALQVFKKPGADMGRYKQSYLYRCPNSKCRNAVLEPPVTAALEAIDWSLPGERIGDRPLREFTDKKTGEVSFGRLAPKTLARISAGIDRYWGPLAVPVEGRDGKSAAPVTRPLRTMTTRSETGLVVPCGGTWRDSAAPLTQPLATRTTRESDGIAFIAELRGGGSVARAVTEPLATVTASGNHHGLVTTYNGRGGTRPIEAPLATVTAIDRHALITRHNGIRGGHPARHTTPATEPLRTVTTAGHQSLITADLPAIDLDDVRFRMLEPHEIARAMSFATNYVVLGTRRQQVRQLGNAVTPPVAEILISALVEAITGEEIERWPQSLAA